MRFGPILWHGLKVLEGFNKWGFRMEATVSSKAECIALIWCIVTQFEDVKYGCDMSLKVEVWRSGTLVMRDHSIVPIIGDKGFNRSFCGLHGTGQKQVCLYTWRRKHGLVQSLQYGDMVCFHIQHDKDVQMEAGGICMVHIEDENLVMAMNSLVLNKTHSQHFASQFGQLLLEDSSEELDEDIYDLQEAMNLELELYKRSLPGHPSQKRQRID